MISSCAVLRLYKWRTETCRVLEGVQDAIRLDPSPCYGDAPEMLEWRSAALRGAAMEACEAACGYHLALEDVISTVPDGLEKAWWVDERDRLRSSMREWWPLVHAGKFPIPPFDPPWVKPNANCASVAEGEVSA